MLLRCCLFESYVLILFIENELPPSEGDNQHEDDVVHLDKIDFICSEEGVETELDIIIDEGFIFC